MDDTSRPKLFGKLLDILKTLEPYIGNLRGWDYDNGSNMKEKHRGLQKWVLKVNLRTFY